MNEINAHIPSKIIKGTYFKSIEAAHAIEAPIKFKIINMYDVFETLLLTFNTYANKISATPTKPSQSVKFIILYLW